MRFIAFLCSKSYNLTVMQPILKVTNLTKQYKDKLAVDSISFEIRAGEIVGLLGPNGAGKTTIIQMLLSLLTPTQGSVEIFGKDLNNHREEILAQMNFVGPYASLPYNLSPAQNLLIFSYLYGIPHPKERVQELLKEFRLTQFTGKRSGGLSSGEQTRLATAKALLNNPRLLLLDEPTASLDPANARILREKIRQHVKRPDTAVFWTSHNMLEVEQMCDRIIFLSQGKIIADDTPANIREKFHQQSLEDLFVALSENES